MNSTLLVIALLIYIKKIQDQESDSGILDYQSLTKSYRNILLGVLSVLFISIFIAGFLPHPLITLILGMLGLALMFWLSAKIYANFQNKRSFPNFPSQYANMTFKITSFLGASLVIVISQVFLNMYDYYGYGFFERLPLLLIGIAAGISGVVLTLILSFMAQLIYKIIPKNGEYQATNHKHTMTFASNVFKQKKATQRKKPSNDKVQHYQAQGLDPHEIDYFRSEMAGPRDQIFSIEEGINQTAKLRAIATRNNTIKVCQTFFKDIVNEPQRLAEAGQFLYKFLPSLDDLVTKYNEVNSHVAKNKQTYQILDKTAQMIEMLCKQINDEYILFHKTTYNELDDEIKLAELNIQRRNPINSNNDNDQEDIFADDILGGETNDGQ